MATLEICLLIEGAEVIVIKVIVALLTLYYRCKYFKLYFTIYWAWSALLNFLCFFFYRYHFNNLLDFQMIWYKCFHIWFFNFQFNCFDLLSSHYSPNLSYPFFHHLIKIYSIVVEEIGHHLRNLHNFIQL